MTDREYFAKWGLQDRYDEYAAECREAADYCESQGWPSNGSNYELMVQGIRENYPDLWGGEE